MFPNGWVKFVMAFQVTFFAYQAIEFVEYYFWNSKPRWSAEKTDKTRCA